MRESQRPSEKPRQTRQTGQTRQASAQSRRTASKRYEERAKRSCSADTAQDVLWHIAEYAPRLRKWLVANPSATPAMLEYLAQVGGPGVPEALRILLKSLEMNGSGSDQPFIASTAL